MDAQHYDTIKKAINVDWEAGVDALFDERGVEHREKLDALIGGKNPNKTYVSPSRSSIFINANGIPQLQGMCHRSLFLQHIRMTETNPRNAATKRKLLLGTLIEQIEHDIEKRTGKYVGSNELVTYDIDDVTVLLGETDSRLTDDRKNIYVKEIKGVFGYMGIRNHIKGTRAITPYPRWSAVLQIMLYIAMLGLKYGVLKFIDGQNMTSERIYIIELKPIMHAGKVVDQVVCIDGVEKNDITMSAVITRFMALARYMKKLQLPPRECTTEYSDEIVEKLMEVNAITKAAYTRHMTGEQKCGDWQCHFCAYKDLCYMSNDDVDKLVQQRLTEREKKEESDSAEPSGEMEAVW